jgi:DNA polymerase III epsilon subunit-like protein/nitrogen fixation-related uncharacterized protein
MISQHPNPRHRLQAARWAKTLFHHPENVVVLDTETTGLDEDDEIVQIAISELNGKPLINTLVRLSGRKAIPRDATSYHGIKTKDLQGKPSYREMAGELQQILKRKTVVAYNAEYDFRMMVQTAAIAGGYVPDQNRWHCAMQMYARFYGEICTRFGGYKWQKLPDTAHVAENDVATTIRLLKRMAEFADSADEAERIRRLEKKTRNRIWRLGLLRKSLDLLASCHKTVESVGVPAGVAVAVLGFAVSVFILVATGWAILASALFIGCIVLSGYLWSSRPEQIEDSLRRKAKNVGIALDQLEKHHTRQGRKSG